MDSPHARYTLPAIVLHWVSALLVLGLFGLGWYMVDLPKGPARGEIFALHKSLGITAFLLAALRLAWRTRHQPPTLPDTLPLMQRRIVKLVHGALYVLLFLHPLTGYLSSQFAGYGTKYLGIALPQWGWKSQPINEFFTECHEVTAICLFLLIIAHLAGAFSHLFGKSDNMVRRMLP